MPKPQLEVSFPVIPFSDSIVVESWELEYPEDIKDGRLCFVTETAHESTLIISIARGVNLPVLAYPNFVVTSNSGVIRFKGNYPAAAVYPVDVSGGLLTLNWSDGFACDLIKRSMENSNIMSGFDTKRFREVICEKSVNLPGASWCLDDRTILSRLAYGVFRESSVQEGESMSFSIPVSGKTFFSDNVLYPCIEATNKLGLLYLEVSIPVKRKTTFINTENGELVEVFFNETYWCFTNLFTGYSLSGR